MPITEESVARSRNIQSSPPGSRYFHMNLCLWDAPSSTGSAKGPIQVAGFPRSSGGGRFRHMRSRPMAIRSGFSTPRLIR